VVGPGVPEPDSSAVQGDLKDHAAPAAGAAGEHRAVVAEHGGRIPVVGGGVAKQSSTSWAVKTRRAWLPTQTREWSSRRLRISTSVASARAQSASRGSSPTSWPAGSRRPPTTATGACTRSSSGRSLRATVANRWVPMASGPGTPRSRAPAHRVTDLTEVGQTLPAAPDKRAPPGNRLGRGSPGGVWARDIPCIRRPAAASSAPRTWPSRSQDS
jgi:hypothetical protein